MSNAILPTSMASISFTACMAPASRSFFFTGRQPRQLRQQSGRTGQGPAGDRRTTAQHFLSLELSARALGNFLISPANPLQLDSISYPKLPPTSARSESEKGCRFGRQAWAFCSRATNSKLGRTWKLRTRKEDPLESG
jgi:hypothetical protein